MSNVVLSPDVYRYPTKEARSPCVLVLPTLEGRQTLPDTLNSLATAHLSFDYIVVSVNGRDSAEARLAIRQAGLHFSHSLTVLCTKSVVSAMQHAKFISKYLVSSFDVDTLLFLLADDDLLPPQSDLPGYIGICQKTFGVTIGMGNLFAFVDRKGPFTDFRQHISPGEQITSLEFLRRNRRGHLATNMSSMLVPCRVFCDCIGFMSFWGSAGRRLEYILATHKSVETLLSPSTPSAFIRHHPEQEGRVLSRDSMLRDELIFMAWVWLNQPATRPWIDLRNEYGFTLIRFAKVAVFSLLLLRLLRLARAPQHS